MQGGGRRLDLSIFGDLSAIPAQTVSTPAPVKLTPRRLREALEDVLVSNHSRMQLEEILPDDLGLEPRDKDVPVTEYGTKRALVSAFIEGHGLPWLVELARRVVAELVPDDRLITLINSYEERGGVADDVKNLIFAANGPKPELVLRDAIHNRIEITKNEQYCLIYDRPISPDGLTFKELLNWWRERESLESKDDTIVGRELYQRLKESLGDNVAEKRLFYEYNCRYQKLGYEIPALVPQVYLHYDPYTASRRGAEGSPLPRQRMDFLLLFSGRRRVVLEIDGSQHYSTDGFADPKKYATMVREDRRLRLDGYEIYRFSSTEMNSSNSSKQMLNEFFDDLQQER